MAHGERARRAAEPSGIGLALPDCRAHAPNENFLVENFFAGIRLNRAIEKREPALGRRRGSGASENRGPTNAAPKPKPRNTEAKKKKKA